jgi:hypothetical protein
MTRRDADIIGYMYNDTEQKIREQIAREIEETMPADTENVAENFSFEVWNMAVSQCAAIARGNK